MKRIIVILLVAVLLFGTIPMASAASLENFNKTRIKYRRDQFFDVRDTDWFTPGVASAYEMGLMKGVTDSSFKPAGNLTVAEALAIACRLHSIYTDNKQEFTQGNPWYQVYVDYAIDKGIVKEDQLDPTKQITREQFAYLMCGSLSSEVLESINNITEIPDVIISSTYGEHIFRLYSAGVLTGSDKYGTFKPTTAIQRSEVATIVTRMADKSLRKTFALEKKPLEPMEIQLSGKTQILSGESTVWTATVLPEGAQTNITWTAGNPGVATVDQSGNITTHKAGQCNITAKTSNGVTKTALLTVGEVAVTGINLAGNTNCAIGGSVQWTASPIPASAATSFKWKAGNPGVATVDQNGTITGHKAGQCNITVSAANGVSKTVMVTVSQGGTLQNPYEADGTVLVTFQDYSFYPAKTFKITCINMVKGDQANQLLPYDADDAIGNLEWRVYEFKLDYVSSTGGASDEMDGYRTGKIFSDESMYTTSGSKAATKDAYVSSLSGNSPGSVSTYPGGTATIVYGVLVNKNAGDLLLKIPYLDTPVWMRAVPVKTNADSLVTAALTPKDGSNNGENNSPIKIILRDALPKTLSTYHDNSNTKKHDTCIITDFSYSGKSTVTLQFTGEKTYDENGSGQSRAAHVGWKLYDSENYVIDSGTAYSSSVRVGEKFKDCKDTVYGLKNGTYYLEIMSTN